MFMYVFLVGLVALMLFGMYQVLETRTVCVSISRSSFDVKIWFTYALGWWDHFLFLLMHM